MRASVLDDAYRGEFEVVVCWAADRVSRGGIEELLKLIRELRERNCQNVGPGRRRVVSPGARASPGSTAARRDLGREPYPRHIGALGVVEVPL
jgi:hypothetical protein